MSLKNVLPFIVYVYVCVYFTQLFQNGWNYFNWMYIRNVFVNQKISKFVQFDF